MSFLKIDDLNEIYFEYIKPKKTAILLYLSTH
jgi:hypothetical protein